MISELGDDSSLVPVLFEQRVVPGNEQQTLEQALDVCRAAIAGDGAGGVVLKPSHSCRSRGLVLIHNADRCEATHDNGYKQETSLAQLDPPVALTKVDGPLGCAPMALSACEAGVLVQPMLPHELEVRVVCVFGCALTAIATAGPDGEREFMYNRESHSDGFSLLKAALGSELWAKCAAVAEAVARGTDLLRVDLFVSLGSGSVLLNEVDYIWQYVSARGWHGWIGADQIAAIWAQGWVKAFEFGAVTLAAGCVPAQVAAGPLCVVGDDQPVEVGAEGEDSAAGDTENDGNSEAARRIEVGGAPVLLDEMGPLVVSEDGMLSRIANWETMNERERAMAFKLLTKRNAKRLAKLRGEPGTSADTAPAHTL